ncbi:MAG: ACT domain-containing protein [Hadesarchaea archaeon]|nr:ACT domain-containing protein [Hadesarchaea archaeon]
MRVRIEMELEDVPGQLVKALEPISKFGANIQNVVHQRERKTPLGRVPVTVIFDVDDRERLDRILKELRDSGARITLVGEREGMVKKVVLLVGHIVHTNVRDTIDRVNSLEGVRISDLSLAMGGAGEESAARIIILADNEGRAEAALRLLDEIAAEKKLLVIKEM